MAVQPNAPGSSGQGQTGTVTNTSTSKPSEMTSEAKAEEASKLVDRFAIWSGAAGLIPLPVVDLVAVGGLQLQMLRRISQIYDLPFSENRGKALITSLMGAAIPTTSGLGAAEFLKTIPVFGTIISSFVTPVLAAGATYAIGKVFIQHFSSGGTLLDFNPPDYREFLQGQKEMWVKRSTSESTSSEHAHASSGATGS